MASHDSLIGITNIADYDLSQIVAGSYITHLDWGLVNVGAFNNVRKGNTNINSADLSKLRLSNNPDYASGTCWETTHNNLVWESGISVTTKPISISGVYVNNVFRPLSGVGTYKHHIEYTTGRVVFDNAIATNSIVNMEYSYKSVSVIEAKNYPTIREIQFKAFDPYNNNFTQYASGDYAKSPNARIRLPLIGIELPVISSKPHELGNLVKKNHVTIVFHVLAEDDAWVRKLVTVIANQKESTIFLMDFNTIARSGAFPLSAYGILNSGALTYPNIIARDEYKYCTSYMMSADGTAGKWISTNLYHGSVRSVVEVIY